MNEGGTKPASKVTSEGKPSTASHVVEPGFKASRVLTPLFRGQFPPPTLPSPPPAKPLAHPVHKLQTLSSQPLQVLGRVAPLPKLPPAHVLSCSLLLLGL